MASTTTSTLPILLPPNALPTLKPGEWQPTRDLNIHNPAPAEDRTTEQELAAAMARQMLAGDGKTMKKVRPRRTVDYGGPMGRWNALRKFRHQTGYVPYLRPAPPYIIDLLPPKAYPENVSTSLCTKFVHTSTNKIRCPVNCVVWTPEGRRILTGSTSGEFTLWNGLTFNFETILQAHDTAVRALQFSHSGAFLASADQSGIIKYFQPNMNNLTAWQGHREAVRGLSFSPDDGRFATASDDSTVRIWAFEESREERVLTGHGWDVKCVEWHPTKGLLVSGSKDNMIKFWDPRSGTVLSTLHYHKNTIQALAWSPNGNLVASASRDQTVRVFDIRAMKEFRVLKGHKKEVCSVTWHPHHPILVSGGSEGAILHWDLSSSTTAPIPSSSTTGGAPIPTQIHSGPRATLSQAHDSNVWSLAYHPLGHILVSASNDHTTRFWCRERPGDASSVFSGGGVKPPEAQAADGEDEDDEDAFVPGFQNGPGRPGGGWDEGYSREDEFIPGFGESEMPDMGGGGGGGGGMGMAGGPSGSMDQAYGGPRGNAPPMAVVGRHNGPLPPQEDMYGHGDGSQEEGAWGRGGQGQGQGQGYSGGGGRGGGRGGARWAGRRPRY